MQTNKNKIYIISSIFVLISLLLIIFFVLPLFKEIEKNSRDLVLAKSDVANLDVQIKETSDFKKKYQTYKPNFDKIDQLFVDPKNPVNFIEFLEKTALNYKTTSQISLVPISSSSNQFILLQITSKGSFSNVLSFIKQIEVGPYLVEIEDLTIQDSDQNTQTNDASRNVNVVFTIEAFIKQ